jgi:hypothetical protein
MPASVRAIGLASISLAALLMLPPTIHAQRGPQGRGGNPPAAGGRGAGADRAFDPSGYWVSIVSDEWRYRMLTPAKGNVDYVPVSAEGRRVAGLWDPNADESSGQQCKAYGAGGVMRLPGRLHVTWDDANTLRIDIDTGTQTRLLHFNAAAPPPAEESWQGYSLAAWQFVGRGAPPSGQSRPGQLKVVTTHLRPGYLRKNGVPYSAKAVLTEYFNLLVDQGTEYLAVTTMLEDPEYLLQPWVRTSQFKKQGDAKGWNPTPCEVR